MKHLFFEKGQKSIFSVLGEYLVDTSNNLDSKKYILNRIPIQQVVKDQNYIEHNFYFTRDTNLISYFNCWKQTEQVLINNEKPTLKQKQKKKEKKKMMEVIKRKSKIQTEPIIAPIKSKNTQKEIPENNQNLMNVQVVYVQMQYFSEIQIPNDFSNCRDLIVIVYLLAMKLQKKMGSLPCLIPVRNDENDKIKFFKKAQSVQIQLYRLMKYIFRERQQQYLNKWSQSLCKMIHKAEINKDELLIGSLLKNSISEYLNQSHCISLIKQQQKMCTIQKVRIVDYVILSLQQSDIEIPIDEYKIEYLLKSQQDREIVLVHDLFEEYTLYGKKSNLIVKWLYHMST